jgi:hypothetical protein
MVTTRSGKELRQIPQKNTSKITKNAAGRKSWVQNGTNPSSNHPENLNIQQKEDIPTGINEKATNTEPVYVKEFDLTVEATNPIVAIPGPSGSVISSCVKREFKILLIGVLFSSFYHVFSIPVRRISIGKGSASARERCQWTRL